MQNFYFFPINSDSICILRELSRLQLVRLLLCDALAAGNIRTEKEREKNHRFLFRVFLFRIYSFSGFNRARSETNGKFICFVLTNRKPHEKPRWMMNYNRRAHSLPNAMEWREMRVEEEEISLIKPSFDCGSNQFSSQFHFDTWIIQFHKFIHGYKAAAIYELLKKSHDKNGPSDTRKYMQTNESSDRLTADIFCTERRFFLSYLSTRKTTFFYRRFVWMQQILCVMHNICVNGKNLYTFWSMPW